jgi:hypothetical protein
VGSCIRLKKSLHLVDFLLRKRRIQRHVHHPQQRRASAPWRSRHWYRGYVKLARRWVARTKLVPTTYPPESVDNRRQVRRRWWQCYDLFVQMESRLSTSATRLVSIIFASMLITAGARAGAALAQEEAGRCCGSSRQHRYCVRECAHERVAH